MLLIFLLFNVVVKSDLIYKTFQARAISLKSGQVIQTPTDWGPLPWPEGKVAIRHFGSDIVDSNGISVPLEELYVHHWLMYDGTDAQNGGFCTGFLSNIFGAGAEIRGIQIDAPYPYALVSEGTEKWTANLHFIRTSNVPQKYLQDCVECRCRSSNPPKFPSGSVACCPDKSMCWGMENSTLDDPKDYYFQYTLGWEPWTPEHIPVKVYSTDITSHINVDCLIEYDIPEVPVGGANIRKTNIHIPSNWNISYIETHQHIGGVNMTLEHVRNGKNLGVICTSAPVYSAQHGYIEDIPPCHYPEPYRMLAGDTIHMTSIYDGRSIVGGHPWHSGVMSLAFIVAHADPFPKEICLKRVHELCGNPPYNTVKECTACVSEHLKELTNNYNCTVIVLGNECEKSTGGGNVPTPDEIHDMKMSRALLSLNYYQFNVSAPVDAWFGIGFKAAGPEMDGALAWIYNGTHLHERHLGMHNAGKLVNDDVLVSKKSVVGNIVHITFETSVFENDLVNDQLCWLFAQGASGEMTLGYHGSFRGTTCL